MSVMIPRKSSHMVPNSEGSLWPAVTLTSAPQRRCGMVSSKAAPLITSSVNANSSGSLCSASLQGTSLIFPVSCTSLVHQLPLPPSSVFPHPWFIFLLYQSEKTILGLPGVPVTTLPIASTTSGYSNLHGGLGWLSNPTVDPNSTGQVSHAHNRIYSNTAQSWHKPDAQRHPNDSPMPADVSVWQLS